MVSALTGLLVCSLWAGPRTLYINVFLSFLFLFLNLTDNTHIRSGLYFIVFAFSSVFLSTHHRCHRFALHCGIGLQVTHVVCEGFCLTEVSKFRYRNYILFMLVINFILQITPCIPTAQHGFSCFGENVVFFLEWRIHCF